MELFSIENLLSLIMLVMLQAVLGFDNLLYISLESKRVAPEQQALVRKLGISLAVILRICLLFIVVKMINTVSGVLFEIHQPGVIDMEMTLHSLIVLLGGFFILYTAVKEITHMLVIEHLKGTERKPASFVKILTLIIIMNLVFSFDSILSAVALTDVFPVMATAIVIGGILMIVLAEKVASFLEKNRMFEVIGLFILLIVGILLLSEGAEQGHIHIFGYEITAMSKATFYFVIGALVLVELIQSRYAKQLLAQRQHDSKQAS